jgi:P-type E1-E2 ATPase
VQEASNRGLLHKEEHSKVEYVVAHGIVSGIEGKRLLIGSYHFVFEDEKCIVKDADAEKFESLPSEYSQLYLAEGGVLIGVILIEDPLREDAAHTIEMLHRSGFDNIVMMTGDSERTARAVAKKVGVDRYFSEVLPEDKAAFIRSEHEKGRKVIMIGDGINDSPALSASDAGIAISNGAAIAREIADITIAGEDLMKLVTLRNLSRNLMDRIDFNYRVIVGFNAFLILMGAMGIFPATTTAVLHNSSTIMISLHSMTDLIEKEK